MIRPSNDPEDGTRGWLLPVCVMSRGGKRLNATENLENATKEKLTACVQRLVECSFGFWARQAQQLSMDRRRLTKNGDVPWRLLIGKTPSAFSSVQHSLRLGEFIIRVQIPLSQQAPVVAAELAAARAWSLVARSAAEQQPEVAYCDTYFGKVRQHVKSSSITMLLAVRLSQPHAGRISAAVDVANQIMCRLRADESAPLRIRVGLNVAAPFVSGRVNGEILLTESEKIALGLLWSTGASAVAQEWRTLTHRRDSAECSEAQDLVKYLADRIVPAVQYHYRASLQSKSSSAARIWPKPSTTISPNLSPSRRGRRKRHGCTAAHQTTGCSTPLEQQQPTPTYAAVVSNNLDAPHAAQTSSLLQAEETIQECRACAQAPTWAKELMDDIRTISKRNADAIAELLVLLQALKDSALFEGRITGSGSGVLVSKASGRSLEAFDPDLDAAELLAYAGSKAAELQHAEVSTTSVEPMLVQTLAQSVGNLSRLPCDSITFGNTSGNEPRGGSSKVQINATTAVAGLRSKAKAGPAWRRLVRANTGRVRGPLDDGVW